MTVILKFKALWPIISFLLLATATQAADPTRPEVQLTVDTATVQSAVAPVLPKLRMIRSQGSHYQALLDGQWRKAGEKFGAYRVRSISASQVTLVQGERSLVLNLFQTTTTTK